MKTSVEWLEAAEPLLAASKDAPHEHGAALRILVEEGLELIRGLRHEQLQRAKADEIGWRRKRLMAQQNAKRKYGYS